VTATPPEVNLTVLLSTCEATFREFADSCRSVRALTALPPPDDDESPRQTAIAFERERARQLAVRCRSCTDGLIAAIAADVITPTEPSG
jgi:hypothetical protein